MIALSYRAFFLRETELVEAFVLDMLASANKTHEYCHIILVKDFFQIRVTASIGCDTDERAILSFSVQLRCGQQGVSGFVQKAASVGEPVFRYQISEYATVTRGVPVVLPHS